MNFTLPWNTSRSSDRWAASIDDIKNQIGLQVDRLAKLAADAGRDVTTQAAQISSDAGAQVGSTAKDLGNQAARAGQGVQAQAASLAREAPVAAGTLAQQALRGVAELGRNLRSVRVTTETPAKQRGPDVMPGIALLAGVGSGLAIMYFFDPNEGRRRRALLRDQLGKWTRIGRQTAEGKAKDVRNRAVGVVYEARKQVVGRSESEQEMETIAAATRSSSQGNGSSTPTGSGLGSEQPVTSEIV